MSSDVKLFEKEEFGKVRVVMQDEDPWFVASDVAKALGYEKPNNAVNEHCKKMNKITLDPNLGGRVATVSTPPIQAIIIPESDVYRLVMRSNLPRAVEFQDWICEEVIPSIRKTGGYLATKPDDTPESIMARAVLIAQDTIKRLEDRNSELEGAVSEMKPKALFADSVASSTSSILVGQLAALIRQNGVDMGQNRLFEWMRGRGYLVSSGARRNSPTQKSLNMGLFEVKERAINNPDGSVRLTLTTKVTGKGQIYFVNKFVGGFAEVEA